MNALLPRQARSVWPWDAAERLAGDASSRVYYRLRRGCQTMLLVVYSSGFRDRLARDLETVRRVAATGVRVPILHHWGPTWALLEDFGPDDAEATLRRMAPDRRAVEGPRLAVPLGRLATMDPRRVPTWNPPLARDRLRSELEGFERWFLRETVGMKPVPAVTTWLDDLAAQLDSHPRRPCHRDYHLNNLFLLDNDEVGVIDVQDLLLGPDTYDPASLLNERSAPDLLDPGFAAAFLGRWAAEIGPSQGWRDRLRVARLQRGLKVVGTFARLDHGGRVGYRPWLIDLCLDLVEPLAEAGAPIELVAAVRRGTEDDALGGATV